MTTPKKQHIAQTLLLRAHSPDTATTLFTERIKQKPLYVRPTSPTPEDNRHRRRLHRLRRKDYFLRHQKPRPLSARERRAHPEVFGGAGGPGAAGEYKYATFQGLHALWVEYMLSVLDLKDPRSKTGCVVTPSSHGSKLVSCDYHGAEVEVVRSRCAGRVGVRGIVVRDGMFAFTVVGEGDQVTLIPKEHTVFRFELPLPFSSPEAGKDAAGDAAGDGLVFELHGSQFQNRPVDRANKKFKWRNVDYV
ncbi:putative ribonuclease P complex subunit Pop4 [Aspergillus japonicus CBS 114.51]|uniref:Ribonuclease P protein subunit n=1 Tax=Aspergillus japonicus CBS 114.51 TaxID=1448312 RepID=A0A8T8WVU1_ASPJA|nr:putative ribonuclease P complex subunit Pop4 [Aspergillus japonicus CBS 114.51]RAH79958.1 putative ribonuclease P complex subunit Pop4 [Aspergillus japonicus CBS 114.51]